MMSNAHQFTADEIRDWCEMEWTTLGSWPLKDRPHIRLRLRANCTGKLLLQTHDGKIWGEIWPHPVDDYESVARILNRDTVRDDE